MLKSIHAVTYSVSNFDASCAALATCFGYRRLIDGHLDDDLARLWNAPRASGARYAVFGPASGEPVYVRFVEQPATPGYEPLKTFGWNAAELHARDVNGLADTLGDSPFEILGGPRDLLGNGTAVALQVIGPSREVFYLTEINGENMQRTYGRAESDVGRLFIAVLGASDHQATRQFYAPLTKGTPRPRRFPIRVLAAAHGLDPMTTHFPIGSAVLESQFRIEIDGYPESAIDRPSLDGFLPPGLCMVSFNASDPDNVAVNPFAATPGLDAPPYSGRSVRMLQGPDAEWSELIASSSNSAPPDPDIHD